MKEWFLIYIKKKKKSLGEETVLHKISLIIFKI